MAWKILIDKQSLSIKSKIWKYTVLFLIYSIPLFITSGLSDQFRSIPCQDSNPPTQTNNQCSLNYGANNSWMSWLYGDSRSTLFQMIDLFELVNSPNKNTETRVLNTHER